MTLKFRYTTILLLLAFQASSVCHALDCVLIGTTFDDSELGGMREPRTIFEVVSISDGREPKPLGSFTGLSGNDSLINSNADWLIITGEKFKTPNITAWHTVSVSDQVIVHSGYCANYFISFRGVANSGAGEDFVLFKMRNINTEVKEPRFISINRNGDAKQMAADPLPHVLPGSGAIFNSSLRGWPIIFQNHLQRNTPIDFLPPTGKPGIYHLPDSVPMPPEFTEGEGGLIYRHDNHALAVSRPRNQQQLLTVNSRIDYYIQNKWASISGQNMLGCFFLGDWLIIPEYKRMQVIPESDYVENLRTGRYILVSVKTGEIRKLEIELTSAILMMVDKMAIIIDRNNIKPQHGPRIRKYNMDTGVSQEIYQPKTFWNTTYCLLCKKPIDKMVNNDAASLVLDTNK